LRTVVVAVEVHSFVGIAAVEAFAGIAVDLERARRQKLQMILQTWTKKMERQDGQIRSERFFTRNVLFFFMRYLQ